MNRHHQGKMGPALLLGGLALTLAAPGCGGGEQAGESPKTVEAVQSNRDAYQQAKANGTDRVKHAPTRSGGSAASSGYQRGR